MILKVFIEKQYSICKESIFTVLTLLYKSILGQFLTDGDPFIS